MCERESECVRWSADRPSSSLLSPQSFFPSLAYFSRMHFLLQHWRSREWHGFREGLDPTHAPRASVSRTYIHTHALSLSGTHTHAHTHPLRLTDHSALLATVGERRIVLLNSQTATTDYVCGGACMCACVYVCMCVCVVCRVCGKQGNFTECVA